MDNRQVDVIEARVQGAIRDAIAIAKREKRGDAGYTIAVKESLTGLGHELGYVVCASSCMGADNGEWLFDLTWVEERKSSNGGTEFMEMPLVVESEWTEDLEEEILSDFDKLMVARACLRVMIFQGPDSQTNERCLEGLRERIAAFAGSKAGDRYLFAFLNTTILEVEFQPHVA
jgi:hypothetical protein